MGDQMKEYTITITESLSKNIIVEACNEEQAKQIVQSIYEKGEVVLYPEECDIEVDFEVRKNIS